MGDGKGGKGKRGWSVFLALLCFVVLATAVDRGFERVRSRPPVAPIPSDATSVTLPIRNPARLAGWPVAVILRLRAGAEPTMFTIALDEVTLKTVRVARGDERRVDASGYLADSADHHVRISADRTGWSLLYAEIANVHGFSRGLIDFVIAPRDRQPRRVPWWLAAAAGLGLLALRPRPDWPRRRTVRRLHRAAMGVVLLLFAAGLLAHLISPFRLLLSPGTFLLLAAVLYADPLAWAGRRVGPTAWMIVRPRLRYAPHAAVIVLVLWSVGQLYRPKVGFTPLILFGGSFESSKLPTLRNVPHWVDVGSGYDGQFYAQLAIDPLLRSDGIRHALDSPAYRGRRILLPWTAHVLGWGDPWRVLQAYALLNVASWLVLAFLLTRWLPPGAARPTIAWTACLLGEGLLASMRQSLPDGASVLILALAVRAVERNRRSSAAVLLAIAALARETNLIGAVLLAPDRVTKRSLQALALQGLIVILPLLSWMLYLSSLGLDADDTGLRNFGAPFAAYLGKWSATLRDLQQGGWESYARFSLLTLIGLTTQAVFFASRPDWRSPWWRLGIAYALLAVVLGDAVWEGHPGAVGRVVLPMTVAFNVLVSPLPWRSFLPLAVLGNAAISVGLDMMKVPWLSSP
ncbi:MAG TPA: hypothetical protein VD833_07330 [Vicinamibacterales bacterium]|nr:hypothetical protein [Vicinamibacterales bacterium]